jgi:hypothetical protein
MLMNPSPLGVNDVLAARVKLWWIERTKAASDITQALDGLLRLKQEVDLVLGGAASAPYYPPVTAKDRSNGP